MIDSLVGQCGEPLANLWKRDEGGTGQYPPLSLHVSDELTSHCLLSALVFICDFYTLLMLYFLPADPQALLDIYLLENIDETVKHAIVSFD